MQNHIRQENAVFAVLIGLLLVLLAVGSANSMPLKEDIQKYSYSEGYKPHFGLLTAKSQSNNGFAASGLQIRDSFDPSDDNSSGASWMFTNDTLYGRNLPTGADYDWFRFNATNGTIYKISFNATEKITLTLYDTDASTFVRDIKLTNGTIYWFCGANGTYFIETTSYYNNTPNLSYNVSVLNVSESYITGGDEHEIDNAWQLADPILNNTTSNRTIFPFNDIDFFKFAADQNKFYIIETSGSAVDTLAYLYGTDGKTLLAYNDDIAYYPTIINRTNSRIVHFFNQSGNYYFSIESAYYYQTGAYNVTLTSPEFSWATTNGAQIQRNFTPRGTSHWFEFNVTEGNNYVLKTQNITSPQDYADTYLYVYDSNGTLIGSNDDLSLSSVNSRVTIKAASNGTYFAQVYDRYNGYNTGYSGVYNFSISNYTLTPYLLLPTTDKNITQKGTFKISFGVRCSGDCGNVTAVLDPVLKEESNKVSEKVIDSAEEDSKPVVSVDKKDISQESTKRYILTLKTEAPLRGMSTSSKASLSLDAQNSFEQKFSDIKVSRKMSALPVIVSELTSTQLEKLSKDTSIKSISEDKVMTIDLNESVPLIRANDTWSVQFGGQNLTGKYQTVCIIDSGANYSHPNLAGAYLGGYDYVNSDSNPMDDNGHGTHVTGIIVSNNTTFRGVAPEAKFVALKAMDATGSGYSSDIISSIDWCIANASALNISVISMSLGDNTYHTNNSSQCAIDWPDFYTAINNAVDANITVVIASGNEHSYTGISAPACIDSAISVGAVDKSDNIDTSYSNSGSNLDLLAPGTNIVSTWYTGGFVSDTGTSMATPHAAGAALILNQFNKINYDSNMEPSELLSRLNSSGKQILDSRNGLTFSRIDIYAATSKDTVPMNSGSPFYTTSQNPRYAASEACLKNMVEGSTCNLTWTVNATGAIGSRDWSFFSIFYSNYNNDSKFNSGTVNMTISSQNVVPDLSITTPTINQEFPAGNITVNATATCNTSLVKNVTMMFYNSSYNSTPMSLSESSNNLWLGNISTQAMADGNYTLRLTANNSLNLGSVSEVNFTVDVLPPRLNIVSTFPQNTSHPWINFTIDDYETMWFSLDGGANETIASNFTLNLTYPGSHRLILYANDSFSNLNNSAVNFTENFGLNLTNWSNAVVAASEVASVNVSNGSDITGNGNATIFGEMFNITLTTTNGYNVSMLNVNPNNASWWSIFHVMQSNLTLQTEFNNYGTNITKLVEVTGFEQFFNATYSGKVSFGAVNFTSLRYCNSSAVSNVSTCSLITSNCSGTPSFCYNYSDGNLTVYVPHFSTVVVLNDSIAPKVNIISPQATNYYNESMYNITANVSTSDDATSCVYSVNTSSTNYTLTRSGSYFTGTVSGVRNGAVKFTAYCSDGINTNSSFLVMYMNDSVDISISGPTTKVYEVDDTSAKFKIYTNKDSNMTVFYSRSSGVDTSDDSISSSTFTKTHTGLLLDDLSSDRTYYFFIQVCDRQDDCIKTSESSFTTSTTTDDNTSDDDSGGLGGSGGTSSAPTKASASWNSISANTETNWLIVSSGIPVTKITFTLSKSSTDATMDLENYGTTKPSGVLTSPNVVNSYLKITSSMPDSVKSARIYFSIPQSWFTTNKYDSDKVRVYRLVGSDWTPLFTSKVGTSGSSYTYYADTPGFSFFAITTVAKEVTPTPGNGEGYADDASVNQVSVQGINFTCGNGICSENETAQTCPQDCGTQSKGVLQFFDKVKGVFEVYGLYLSIAGATVLIGSGVSAALIIRKKRSHRVSEPETKGKTSANKVKEKSSSSKKEEHKPAKAPKKKEDRLAGKMASELKKGPGVFKLE